MEKTISIGEVLRIIDLKDERGFPVSFDIELREFSRQNKTGGKYKVYNMAKKATSNPRQKKTEQSLIGKLFNEDKARKNPNHFENRTRNIELSNGSIKTVNYLFIIKFNNKFVTY